MSQDWLNINKLSGRINNQQLERLNVDTETLKVKHVVSNRARTTNQSQIGKNKQTKKMRIEEN